MDKDRIMALWAATQPSHTQQSVVFVYFRSQHQLVQYQVSPRPQRRDLPRLLGLAGSDGFAQSQ